MKKVLIIGANSDMGKSFARDCAQKGSDLILTGRDQARLEQLADDLKIRNNIGIETILFDITKRDQIISFYENLPSKPDVVACFIGFLAESNECTNNFEITENIININFTNIILILDQIANAFENFNNGTIIAVSSTAGDRGRASRYHYGSAKSGLNTYLSGLRQRLYKSNVRVINIKPGFCGTKMIKGIGIDSIEQDRIYRILSKYGYRFQDKILGPEEKKEIEIKSNQFQKARYLSNNFACKEALSKALGLGIAGGVSFKEIQILRDPKGKPYINLSGNTKKISNKLDIQNIYVSITDTSNLSTAFVIGE